MHAYLNINKNTGEQEKKTIIRVRVGWKNPSLGITVCHHLASLVMPNSDPRDSFFYPILTLMIDSYVIYSAPLIILYQFNSKQLSI